MSSSLRVAIAAACAACTLAHSEASEALRNKAEETCASCHGPLGAKPALPETPRLAGQQYEYLVQSLRSFRSGARESLLMGAIAKPLSDADIRGLASYYASLPGLRTKY
jgi:cytochrome c553